METEKSSFTCFHNVHNSCNISQLKSEKSKTCVDIEEITCYGLEFPEGVKDFGNAIKICHESLLKYLSYINVCYHSWKANTKNSIKKQTKINIFTTNEFTNTFLNVLGGYEKKAETAEPLKKQQVKLGHSKSDSPQWPTNTETKLKFQIRDRSFYAWTNELRGMRKTVKSIEKDVERYLNYFPKLYFLFLAHKDFIEDFGAFDAAMMLNSKIAVNLFERQMTKVLNFHNKALHDYNYRLNMMQPGEVNVGNRNTILNYIEINVPRCAEQFVTSVETIILNCHSQLNYIFKRLKNNHVLNNVRKVDEIFRSITRFYEKSGERTKEYLQLLPRSMYRNESEQTIIEYRKVLEIPQVDICLMKEENENEAEEMNHSNSTSYSTINRTFEVQKIYESSRSTIIGRDFQNLLKKCEKYLKDTLQRGTEDATKRRHRLKKVVARTYLTFSDSLKKTEKKSWNDLETNRKRARMFIRYRVDLIELGGTNGQSKKQLLKKYLKELNVRTNCHFDKIKQVSRLLLTFFEKTNREYTEWLKTLISDLASFHSHKVTVCEIFLRTFNLEFSVMAETAHSQLLSIAQEMEMKQSMAYAISEFVKGLKWADHNYMKYVVESCIVYLNEFQHCYITPSTPTYLTNPNLSVRPSLNSNIKNVDIHETIQVLNLYFAGFLNSQSTPEDTNEVLVELLRNISEDSSTVTSNTFESISPAITATLENSTNSVQEMHNDNMEKHTLSVSESKDEPPGKKSKSVAETERPTAIFQYRNNSNTDPSNSAAVKICAWSGKGSHVLNTENFNLSQIFCMKEDI